MIRSSSYDFNGCPAAFFCFSTPGADTTSKLRRCLADDASSVREYLLSGRPSWFGCDLEPCMRRLQSIFLVLGIALFVFVVHKVGLASILRGLYLVGWSFLAIFVLELVIDALHSEGWRWCLPARARSVSRLDVFLARTAGVAVNVLTPTASVGGEVVKGMLLRRWVPLADGFASVMVDKLTFAIGQTMFLMIGIFALLGGFALSAEERAVALAALVVWIVAVAAFFLLQRAGIFRVGVGAMRAMFGGSMFVERLPGHAAEFDAKVST
ncbi:MAG: lysylphosphatidylglycerol synthase domain-containing protein, partial [Candidatus Binatia bacterium]